MTSPIHAIIALVTIAAGLAAVPALAAAGAVAGAKVSGDTSVSRDASLSLPGPVVAKAAPRIDTAALSRGIFGDDATAAFDSLGTTTLSRDGSVSETPASDTLRGIFESTVEGSKKK